MTLIKYLSTKFRGRPCNEQVLSEIYIKLLYEVSKEFGVPIDLVKILGLRYDGDCVVVDQIVIGNMRVDGEPVATTLFCN